MSRYTTMLHYRAVAHEQVDENTGMSTLVIMESPDEKKHSEDRDQGLEGKTTKRYLLPSGAHLMVEEGQPREDQLPRGVHISVQEGERVRAGEALMDGPNGPPHPRGHGDGVLPAHQIPDEVVERPESGLEGGYEAEYLVEPGHIKEGLEV